MKVKVFHIRLTREHLQTDQDFLNNFLESVTVKKMDANLVSAQLNFWSILVFYDKKYSENQDKATEKFEVIGEFELTDDEKSIYSKLKKWKYNKANQLRVPGFMVCHNTELMTIAKVRPQTLDEFSIIKGFGLKKISKFGDEIIELLNSNPLKI